MFFFIRNSTSLPIISYRSLQVLIISWIRVHGWEHNRQLYKSHIKIVFVIILNSSHLMDSKFLTLYYLWILWTLIQNNEVIIGWDVCRSSSASQTFSEYSIKQQTSTILVASVVFWVSVVSFQRFKLFTGLEQNQKYSGVVYEEML